MEAVPRLPMLSFELKQSPENTEFGHKLRSYIRDYYHEDPESYSKEIHELEGLRASAIRVSKDVDGVSLLKRYYCQLTNLLSRFPVQEDGAASVTYFWIDIYTNIVYSTTSIRHEMASILYNIGALHAQLGSMDGRTTAEGMKMSCTHFQCSAWCFQTIKDTLGRPKGSDMSPDLMQFLNYITLAQAQECILEKSMMDNRKAIIIAKVGAHVVEYYSLALSILNQNSSDAGSILDTVGSKQHKNWSKYINFKIAYNNCVALLYQGQAMEEQQKMGERLAFYQAAVDKLTEAAKLAKGLELTEIIGDALQFTQDVVEGKRKAAFNDNEYIYHEKVPEKDSLPPIKGASLVKGIPFSVNDPDVAGQDIFARLVPLRAHEASSMYSEEKAKLLRRIGTQVDEKDTELNAFMSSLQLDTLSVGADGDQLPQELVEACAALSAEPEAVAELVNAMDKLAGTYHEVEGMLQDIDHLLKDEHDTEKEWKETFGIDRPPTIVATELTREANKYRKAHAVAGESNQTLHKAMSLHVANLRTLSKPLNEIAQEIPQTAGAGAESNSCSSKSTDCKLQVFSADDERAVIAEVTNLVSKVKDMSSQRAMLVSHLRESVLKDDITGQLVTNAADGGVLDVVFEQEILKHQPQVAILEQNLAAQANILRALTDAYARYAPSRKAASSASRKRQGTIAALLASFNAREDLLAKANKGLEFYCRLEGSVSKLLARVKSVCKVQEEERQQQHKASHPLPKTTLPEAPINTGNPKLKDYLQAMKQGGPPPMMNNHNLPGVMPPSVPPSNNPYYTQNMSPSPVAPPSQPQNPPSAAAPIEHAAHWPPNVRPNPVGSEGTDTPANCNNMNSISPEKRFNNYAASHMDGLKYSNQLPGQYYPQQNQLNSGVLPKVNNDAQPYPSNPNANPAYNYPSAVSQGYNPASNYTQSSAYPAGGYQPSPQSSPAAAKPQATPNYPQQYPQQQYYQPKPPYPTPNSQMQYPPKPLNNYPQQYYQGNPQGCYSQAQTMAYPSPTSTPQPMSYQPPVSNGHQPIAYPTPSSTPQQVAYPAPASTPQQVAYPAPASTPQQVAYPAPASTPQQVAYPAPASTPQQVAYPAPASTPQQVAYPSPASTPQPHQQHYSVQPPQASPVSSQYGNVTQPARPAVYSTPVSTPQPAPHHQGYAPQQGVAAGTGQGYAYTYPYNQSPAYSAPQQGYPGQQFSGNAVHSSVQPGNTTSQYTSAGKPSTNQTNTSQTSVGGQTYANQYSVAPNAGPGQPPTYYNSPYYGYQHQVPGVQSPGSVVPTYQATPNQPVPLPSQYLTYMQARMPESKTNTTHSSSPQKNPSVQGPSSNVDLLAGLDFAVNTPTLVPEAKPSPSKTADPAPTTVYAAPVHQQPAQQVEAKPAAPKPANSEVPVAPPKAASPALLPAQSSGKDAPPSKDPYLEPDALAQFTLEVERLEKVVEGLNNKTLNGPTPLDLKWKELLELQDKDAHKRIISVARCYPMKNRFPDILPFDHSRVELPSTKDDYINASFVKGISPNSSDFILTQAPLPSTYVDFWTMIWEQQIELIICLLNDVELNGETYWPTQRGEELTMGKIRLSLNSVNVKPNWTERLISVAHPETKVSKVLVHLQFTVWPGSSFPDSPSAFLSFVSEGLSQHAQQRSSKRPVVVHCHSGVGRSGVFCLLTAAMAEIRLGNGLPDVLTVATNISHQRRGPLRDRQHLLYAYQSLLYHCQDLLMKRGILTSRSSFDAPLASKTHVRHPSEDFLLGPGSLSQLQSGIEKMGLGAANIEWNVTPAKPETPPPAAEHVKNETQAPINSLSDLTALVPDASSLTPNVNGSKKGRISKEDFDKKQSLLAGGISPQEEADPLSQLDPLWSLK